MTTNAENKNSNSNIFYRMLVNNSKKNLAGSMTGSKSLDEAIAGIGAGLISTLALHPLETVKTRLQGSLNFIMIIRVLKFKCYR